MTFSPQSLETPSCSRPLSPPESWFLCSRPWSSRREGGAVPAPSRGEGQHPDSWAGSPSAFCPKKPLNRGRQQGCGRQSLHVPTSTDGSSTGAQSACSPSRHTRLFRLAHVRGPGLPVDTPAPGRSGREGAAEQSPCGKATTSQEPLRPWALPPSGANTDASDPL